MGKAILLRYSVLRARLIDLLKEQPFPLNSCQICRIYRGRNKNDKHHFGMGHYFRATHEPLLFGVRGKLPTNTNNTRNFLEAKKPARHSGKPDEMYELIEANSPGPYLELFSRVHRDNWTMMGDGIDGEDIITSINKQSKRTI